MKLYIVRFSYYSGYWCKNGSKRKCQAGYYGKDKGLSDSRCNGLCLPGFYCKEGSTSNTQFPCGSSSVHCPLGSSSPKITAKGKYSYNSSTAVDEHLVNATMSWQIDCEKGYYCVDGKRYQCPGGTYNDKIGRNDIKHCLPCPKGMFR